MAKESSNPLMIITGIIVGAGIIYLFWRLNELSKENKILNQKIITLEGNISSFSHYTQYLLSKISSLENETTNLSSKYQQVLAEIQLVKQQIQNDEARHVLNELIQRVRQKRFERTKNLDFYN
jgi:uncharacterized protein YoxC